MKSVEPKNNHCALALVEKGGGSHRGIMILCSLCRPFNLLRPDMFAYLRAIRSSDRGSITKRYARSWSALPFGNTTSSRSTLKPANPADVLPDYTAPAA